MGDKTCDKCGKVFPKPFYLKRHRSRKTPCEAIVAAAAVDELVCKYCHRTFTTKQALSRHIKQYCKIATTDEGMDKLFEHTLQQQIASMRIEQQQQLAEQSAQIAELTALVRGQVATTAPACLQGSAAVTNVQNQHITQNIQNITTNITIRSWSSADDRIYIPASMLRAAFTDNPRLSEYCTFSDEQKTDAELAAPYVLEALMDLTRRAHADPTSRNVYLNPRRADQVMVFDEAAWRVLSLVDAIRGIFDGIAGNISRIIVTDSERSELPLHVQGSASWIPALYDFSPDSFIMQAKAPMSAHLQNTIPRVLH